MHLSLENQATVTALIRAGKQAEADKIVAEWHTNQAPDYPAVVINQRKFEEEKKQLEKLNK